MKTAYICDGRAPCAGRLGCCFATMVIPNPCTHTTNTLYAVNGACAHPENHPERFVIVGDDTDGSPLYFEMPPERGDGDVQKET